MEFGQSSPHSSGGERTRVFNVIRKKGTVPSVGDHHARKFDLIDRVDGSELFRGTKALTTSLFWELLHTESFNSVSAADFVDRSLSKLNWTRMYRDEALSWGWFGYATIFCQHPPGLLQGEFGSLFESSLRRAGGHLPASLDLIALLGALYREALVSGRLADAEVAGRWFRILLSEYFAQERYGKVGLAIHELAINLVFSGVVAHDPVRNDHINPNTTSICAFGSKADALFVAFHKDRKRWQSEFKRRIANLRHGDGYVPGVEVLTDNEVKTARVFFNDGIIWKLHPRINDG